MFDHTVLSRTFSNYEFYPVNAMVALAASIAVYIGLRVLVGRLCKLSVERGNGTWAEILRKTLASTSQLAILAIALLAGLSLLTLPAPWDERVRNLWFIALGMQVAMYLHRAVAIGARHYFQSRTHAPGETLTVAHTLVIWAVQTLLWVVFGLALLANLGINISTFIASLGIGGIAIALAVQNILGDLFASLSIAVDKPFEVGDAISVAGFSGTVEHVGLKTTRIRADSGEQIVIANAELLKSTVRNFKRMSRRRVQFSLRVNPNTEPKLAAQLPAALRTIIEAQEDVQFERAHLKAVDQAALEFDVVYYVNQPSYALFMDRQQAVLLEALDQLASMGISMSPAPQSMLLQQHDDLPHAGLSLVQLQKRRDSMTEKRGT